MTPIFQEKSFDLTDIALYSLKLKTSDIEENVRNQNVWLFGIHFQGSEIPKRLKITHTDSLNTETNHPQTQQLQH